MQILVAAAKYSNESFEDRRGEGFHVNISWAWLVGPKRQGCSAHAGLASYLEVDWSEYSPTRTWITYGNVKEFGNAGGTFGKRCLFLKKKFLKSDCLAMVLIGW